MNQQLDIFLYVLGFEKAEEEAEFSADLETMTEEAHRAKWGHVRFVRMMDKARAEKAGGFRDLKDALNYLETCAEDDQRGLRRMEDNQLFSLALETSYENVDLGEAPELKTFIEQYFPRNRPPTGSQAA
jgi:hypothetical protein